MLQPVKAYLNYLITSKNQYSVHSPFLYDYLTKGLMKQGDLELKMAKSYRKELLLDEQRIEVTDFGAGSKTLKDSNRKVSEIATKAGITLKRGQLLAKTAAYFQPKNILEIGTSLGISTAYLASGAPEATITSLEGCPATAAKAREKLHKFSLNNIDIIVGQFEDTLDTVLGQRSFDLVFFDGNHQEQPTISYFEKCLEKAHEDTLFIFDDIHWTPSMENAWDHIRKHEKVTLSVDTFKWGLIFFNKGMVKQHFTIRI